MWEFCIFEIKYRLRHVSTYVFTAILVSIAALFQAAQGGAFLGFSISMSEKLFINSPRAIHSYLGFMTNLCIFMMATFIYQMFNKDFESKFSYLLFCKPFTKAQYIFGRLMGNIIIMLGIFSLTMIVFALSVYIPGVDKELVTNFNLYWYIEPILTTVIPNFLFISTLFIAAMIATKKTASVFGMGFLLYIAQYFAQFLGRKIEHQVLSTLIDPFGERAFRLAMRGWSVAEMNAETIGLPYYLLYNRLIWIGVSVIVLFVCWKVFNFEFSFRQRKKDSRLDAEEYIASDALNSPPPAPPINVGGEIESSINMGGVRRGNWQSFLSFFNFYIEKIFRSASFYWLTAIGLIFMIQGAAMSDMIMGTQTLPLTTHVASAISGSFWIFMMVIITYFTGELVWASRDYKINLIEDSLPFRNFTSFISKYAAMAVFIGVYIAIMIIVGMVYQTYCGFYDYELGVYFKILFLRDFPQYLLFLLLAFFIHNFVNQKYFAHFVFILFYLGRGFVSLARIGHPLLVPFQLPTLMYSDMSGFGNMVAYFAWMYSYWFLVACVLTSIAVMCWKRGLQTKYFRNVVKKYRNLAMKVVVSVVVSLTLIVAGIIFYNTNILNTYRTRNASEKLQIVYEQDFKHFEFQNQPKIQDIKLNVALYPEINEMYAEGVYVLQNVGDTPIDTLFIHLSHKNTNRVEIYTVNSQSEIGTTNSQSEIGTTRNGYIRSDVELISDWQNDAIKETIEYEEHGITLFVLKNSLAVGDTLIFNFDYSLKPQGIFGGGILNNGTFIHSHVFPSIGYDRNREISLERRRKKLGLPEREDRMLDTDDPFGLSRNYVSKDGDWLSFEVTISTSGDQIALAPGELIAAWTDNSPLQALRQAQTLHGGDYHTLRQAQTLHGGDYHTLRQAQTLHEGDYHTLRQAQTLHEGDYHTLRQAQALHGGDYHSHSNAAEQVGGRNYFTYRIDQNMLNFYTFLSARYEVKRDRWRDVDLEIYYHPGHTYNLDSMMRGMKESLTYYTNAFGPYPHNILRIAEFPRYASFAQAFATLIPFSEGVGFIADVKPNTIDYPFYITAHEVAHQWWAHQLIGGNTRGTIILTESFTEYASLMVVKHRFDDFLYRQQLQYTLWSYLSGRSMETKYEIPLTQAESQQYLIYSKGMLVMNAASRLLSEDVLNQALREFLQEYQYTANPYPNTNDFMRILDPFVPDSLKTTIDDMFNKIVMYDHKILDVDCEETEERHFKTTIEITTEKRYFDEKGVPENVEWSGWMEIGLLESVDNNMNNIFHLEKVWIEGKENTIEIVTEREPKEVILDPYFLKLIAIPQNNREKISNVRGRSGSGGGQGVTTIQIRTGRHGH